MKTEKTKKTWALLGVFFLLLSHSAIGQFRITGEYRPRVEFRNGYSILPNDTTTFASLVSQRSRINFFYEKDKVTTNISIQDVRVWGEESNLKANTPATGIYEAWAKVKFSDNFAIKFGRQALKYDNGRLISINDWDQSGSRHDIAILMFENDKLKTHVGAAYNQDESKLFGNSYKYNVNNYKSLGILWLNYKFSDVIKGGVIGIADGKQKNTSDNAIYVRRTYGGNLIYDNKKTNISLYAYHQSGMLPTHQSVNAYYINPEFSFKVSDITLTLGNEFISGRYNDTIYEESKVFNLLYGSGHDFLGYLDYFTPSNLSNQTLYCGMNTSYFKYKHDINDKLNYSLHYYYFNTKAAIYDNIRQKDRDKYLGSEMDFVISYNYSDEVNIMFGYSAIFANNTLSYIHNTTKDFGHFCYFTFTVKPNFFNQTTSLPSLNKE